MEHSARMPLAKWNPSRDCWEHTDLIDLLSEHLDVYSETFPTSGMTRNGSVYERPTPARHTADSVCSFLPTPQVADVTGGHKTRSGSRSDELLLPGVVETLLPTPAANDSGNTPENHLRKKPGREVVTSLMVLVDYDLIKTGGRLSVASDIVELED